MTVITDINEIGSESLSVAKSKGFCSEELSVNEVIESACNNLHDEISELHEAWRNQDLHKLCDKSSKMEELGIKPLTCLEEELADIILRACQLAKTFEIDIADIVNRKHLYNKSHPYKHGGKLS